MEEEVKQRIQSLPLSDEDRELLLKAFKDYGKKLEIAEFKYKRTVADKTAMSNILNASLEESKKQKRTIEEAKNEINENLSQLNKQKKLIEEQAREAQIETALERVRSRTLAMQKSDELTETASVLFRQLSLLGLARNRLYIIIVKDETGNAELWITDEDGDNVSMSYSDNMNHNACFQQMYNGWKAQKKSLVVDITGQALQDYFAYLNSLHVPVKGTAVQKRRLQYVAYFGKGLIGMASPDEQPAETLQLLERFAYVFNLTFIRFHDLQLAEAHALQAEHDLMEIKAARLRAEEALRELRQTQRQLIESEKMASLGELTAGIAHEIQNPLNFVNNFSEVSKELLDEMKEELATGNWQVATEIAADVIQNLEKITHHGKRADAIVKGMLQHSRTASGQKEPTDINALCDEYLRLSYHGLRAKDKSFTAAIKTDFDAAAGKISTVPQDIGRVLLNLLSNAFYAVNERKKRVAEGYAPTVSVATKKTADNVEISINDNGTGIPKAVVDKIFQPFFTTRPTGQGTGLGLSLAYDIVKTHGGNIRVQTKEGSGTTFTLQLPNQK